MQFHKNRFSPFSISGISVLVAQIILFPACDLVDLQEAAEYRSQTQEYAVGVIPKFYSKLYGETAGLDVLVVIDDSGSMSSSQAAVQNGFSSFMDELRSVGDGLDYRVAITTTHPCTTANDTVDCDVNVDWTIGHFWGDGTSVAAEGDGTYIFEKGAFADDATEDAAFQAAINAVTLVGSGDERGLEVAQWVVENDPNNFFRANSFKAFVFVSDEDECSNGTGCTSHPNDLFTAVKTRWGLSDSETSSHTSLWGILKTTNMAVYSSAISLFGESTAQYPGTSTGNILAVNASTGNYSSFFGRIGAQLASDSLSLGYSAQDFPGCSGSGCTDPKFDQFKFFLEGEIVTQAVTDPSDTSHDECSELTAFASSDPVYCLARPSSNTDPIDVEFNAALISAAVGQQIVYRWEDDDPSTDNLNRTYGLNYKPIESSITVTHISKNSGVETALTDTDFTYSSSERSITLDNAFSIELGDTIRIDYQGGGI